MPLLIEPYQQRTSISGLSTHTPRLDPGALGANAEALGAIGQALQSVQIAIDAKDASEVSQGLAALEQERAPLLESLKGQAALDASGFTPSALEAFDAKTLEIESTLTTRRAKESFRANSARQRRAFELDAQAFEATTRVASRVSGFQQSADRLAVATEANPEGWKERIAEQWQLLNSMGLEPATRLQLFKQMEQKVMTAAVAGLARRDPAGVLQKLSTSQSGDELFDGVSLVARDAARKEAEAQLVSGNASRILQAYERGGAEAGRAALSALDNWDLPPLMRDEVRSKVNEGVARLREQRRQEHADELVAIETAIGSETAGAGTASRVENLYDAGALSTQQYADYIGRIESSIVRRAKDNAAARELADTLRAGLPLDPSNAEHRKALAQSFASDTQALAVGSLDWQATASAYAARTRMLPSQATAWTRQTTRSPDPKIAAAGAQFYGAIAASTPDAVGEVDSDTKAFASTVNSMIEAGTDPARAVETARSIVFDVKSEVLKRRKDEYTEHAKQSDTALAALVGRDFDPGWFASAPGVSAGLAGDFDAQTERYFSKVGDITLARKLAWDDLKRVYGPTRVNGEPMLLPFPPERFGVKPEEIRGELAGLLKDNPQSDGSTSEELVLVPDAITMRQVNDALSGRSVQPSYKVVTKTGDLLLDQQGVPVRYTVPTGEELAKRLKAAEAKAAAESQADVESARREREQRRRDAYTYRGYSGPGVMR